MSSLTLPPHSPDHGVASVLHSLWNGLSVTADVLRSLRHDVGQRAEMQRLLNESNQFEGTDPARSEALRTAAARLLA